MNAFWLNLAYFVTVLSILTTVYCVYWAMQTFRWFVREYAERTSVMAKSAGLVEVPPTRR